MRIVLAPTVTAAAASAFMPLNVACMLGLWHHAGKASGRCGKLTADTCNEIVSHRVLCRSLFMARHARAAIQSNLTFNFQMYIGLLLIDISKTYTGKRVQHVGL